MTDARPRHGPRAAAGDSRAAAARSRRAADLRRLFAAALAAVQPGACLARTLTREGDRLHLGEQRLTLGDFSRVLVLGAGKATQGLGQALAALLGEQAGTGLLVVPDGLAAPCPPYTVLPAGHPLPDARGRQAAARLLTRAAAADARTLLFGLFSGGASALLPAPAPGITLTDKEQLTRLLLASGAPIGELNTVRKHLSRLKGGLLARRAAPATVVGLLLSDVVGDALDVIASGPLAPDPSTFTEAVAVLQRRGVWPAAAPAVRRRLLRGCRGELPETPKPGDPAFSRVLLRIVGDNRQALQAAAALAPDLGYAPRLLPTPLAGEARDAGVRLARLALATQAQLGPDDGPILLLTGGETTVTVRGPGRGGRNQELALAAARQLAGSTGIALLAAGTDGIDGPTDAAGGLVDGATTARLLGQGLDPARGLAENDSTTALDAAGATVRTGPTGTNVMDIVLVAVAGAAG